MESSAHLPAQVEVVVMKDPFPIGPAGLANSIRPISNYLGLTTLPLHIHEVLFAYALYETAFRVISPYFSRRLFPARYGKLNRRQRLNWDAHMVSMYQALFINTAALWVILKDPARSVQNQSWNWMERLWGYNGAAGMCQAFAAGYFLWDCIVSSVHMDVMGPSSLVHAVAALAVTSIGFRPFANYYGLNFVLYELSTPFLNIHWFLDKFDMTGSTAQLINGILLLASFGGSRLVWGSYQSLSIYRDIWHAWNATKPLTPDCLKYVTSQYTGDGLSIPTDCRALPTWLALVYVGGNTALTMLNFYWYWKMIAAVRKRFVPKEDKAVNGKKEK